MHHLTSRLLRSWLVRLLLVSNACPLYAETATPLSAIQQRVDKLIQQLDSQGYVQRKHAENELRHLGHEAFDQLLEAQYNDSSEISLAAKQLIGRLSIAWWRSDDPEITQQVMRDYQRLLVDLRETRSEWLAQLEDGLGFGAVMRIVRYEPSELLSKQAAIEIFKNLDRKDESQVAAFNQAVETVLGSSQRASAEWLRILRDELKEPSAKNLSAWLALAADEEKLDDGPRSSSDIAAELYKTIATHAFRQNEIETAKLATSKLVDLQKDDEKALMATSAWLLDENQTELFIGKVWNRFEDYKKRVPRFVYLAAEALAKDPAESQKLADQAYAMTEDNPGLTNAIAVAIARVESASDLENRGHTEWAIREYKRLAKIEKTALWRLAMIKEQSVIMLSELLHDKQREEEAADVLAEMLTDDSDEFRDKEESAGLVSRMYYFRSEHFRLQSDREKQIEFLRKAIKADPTDADVLIAMYRLPRADKAWKEETRKLIRKAVGRFESRLQPLEGAKELERRADVAKNLNQIAWLVGNTEGDYKRAIAQSRRSLELRPHSPGSLDTLGRAYFADGDLKNAIKYQRRAVMLQPNSLQIQRQLYEFETAAREQAAKE